MNTRSLEIKLGIAILVTLVFAIWMNLDGNPWLSNIGFLVAGGLLTTSVELLRQSIERPKRTVEISRSLYQELANRVARCVFDYEKPWEAWIKPNSCRENEVNLIRLRGFIPIPPVVYPATASQIGLLSDDAAQAIIRFYAAHSIFRKDMEDAAAYCERLDLTYVPPELITRLAERLRRTLKPGLHALTELSKTVNGYELIDAVAIRDSDLLFKHQRSHQSLRERLTYYVHD